VTKSIEDSSSYFATCTASGPLNPFLEQILKEIPNAYSGNASGLNSAGQTAVLNFGGFNNPSVKQELNFNLNIQSSNNRSGNGSKKALGKISKKIQSRMIMGNLSKDKISNSFNLTTTAAALLATSDKNAAAFSQAIDCQTFESRNSNSVSGMVDHGSSKKQALNRSSVNGRRSVVEK